jgi:PhnB protein
MPTIPYLHFQGQCAEAMTFYRDVLGGTDLQIMHYSEAPGAPASDRVIHAQVTLGGSTLMASDYPDGVPGDRQAAVSVMHSAGQLDAARAVFDRLAEGGAVEQPFAPSFFAPGFGMVRDRFGTHWMIVADAEAAA